MTASNSTSTLRMELVGVPATTCEKVKLASVKASRGGGLIHFGVLGMTEFMPILASPVYVLLIYPLY